MTPLSPAQQRTFDWFLAQWSHDNLFLLTGAAGSGKSTLVRHLHHHFGGLLLSIRDLVDASLGREPLALEDVFTTRLREAFAQHDVVFLDELQLFTEPLTGCGSYPRSGWLDAHFESIRALLAGSTRKLVLVHHYTMPGFFSYCGRHKHLPAPRPEDYAFFGRTFLGELAGRLDFDKIHRFAPHLNGYQWSRTCQHAARDETLDTDRFLDVLRRFGLTSNVDLEEVQNVSLADLAGVDNVVRNLETHVVLPLENDELATRFGLKAKRGVLLLGPPGTGKTTVGRALAHRLKGKFFLIDGTLISGTERFYHAIHRIVEKAKENAPSVLFIDDSDVIFQGGEELGLYRYLLTMLDGLESARSGRVCVMLTAMELAALPPALLRSGRIELWLEMKLPDEAARAAILGRHLADWPAEYGAFDLCPLVERSAGFTGADLKRLAEDGRNLFAFDLALHRPTRPPLDCFLEAAATIRANKSASDEADAHGRRQRATRVLAASPDGHPR
jgi:predicted AAA+ superfamily ATPase